MTVERTEIIKSFDGTDIFLRCFVPKREKGKTPKLNGLILFVHGLGEHSGAYEEFAELVTAKNVAVAGFDLRGHGHSGPYRGKVDSLHAMILDTLFVLGQLKDLFGIPKSSETFIGVFARDFGATLALSASAFLREACPPLFLVSPMVLKLDVIPKWKHTTFKSIPQFVKSRTLTGLFGSEKVLEAYFSMHYQNDHYNLRRTDFTEDIWYALLQALEQKNAKNLLSCVSSQTTIVLEEDSTKYDLSFARNISSFFAKKNSKTVFLNKGSLSLDIKDSPLAQEFLKWIVNGGKI